MQGHEDLRGVVDFSLGRSWIHRARRIDELTGRLLTVEQEIHALFFSCGNRQPNVLWIVQAYVTAARSL